ncbi:MAG: ATP-binding protein [Chloroflexi bacterium]|nr:ATP-binding protein [Chloroflexota bacterium]
MLFKLWGATFTPYLTLPNRPLGYFLLALYISLAVWGAYRHGRNWRTTSSRHWLIALCLIFASLITSQLFLLYLPANNLLPPIAVAETPVNVLRLLGFVPILIAALLLDPALVVLVAAASGLGRGMWQTHQIFDLFHFGMVGWLMARGLRQNYLGRFYRWLRRPPVAAPLALVLVLPLLASLATYVYAPAEASSLAALDVSRSTLQGQFLLALLEGLISGGLVSLLVWGIPQLAPIPPQTLVTSPFNRTLNRRLLSGFVLYSAALILVLSTAVFYLSLNVSSDLVINQMNQNATAVSRNIATFLQSRQNLLAQHRLDERLQSDDPDEVTTSLRQLFRTGPFYRRILLVRPLSADDPSPELEVSAFYPNDDVTEVSLTNLEQAAVLTALRSGAPAMSEAHRIDESGSILAFAVPVENEAGEAVAVLVGRVAAVSLQELIATLTGEIGTGSGFIVDDEQQIIAHPNLGSVLSPWQSDVAGERILRQEEGNTAYEGRDGRTNTRRLVYVQEGPDHPWTVIVTVPYDVVLGLALQTGMPIIGVLALATLLFSAVLAWLAQSITLPLTQLLRATERITSGDYATPITLAGDDEVGQLSQTFAHMQKVLRNRVEELSLLLSVSQSVSGSLDVSEGVPPILRGALRGTGAAGVRLVVMNPNGRYPLTFGEGGSATSMSLYDRTIMGLLRQGRELILPNPETIRRQLHGDETNPTPPPFQALVAFALFSHNRFQGVFWLVYRQPRDFARPELDLLRTLAGQAAVLMENARLFATAEGGRRRLAAVLASTADAVIVTDQTNRILLINPATERIFGLKTAEVNGRRVQDVLANEELKAVLLAQTEHDNREIPVGKRTYSANAAKIINIDGQAQGRVAVLHDITHMKELDEMKSNFVQMVSHDLRSPLTYMSGFVTMLPMVGELNEKQLDYVEKVQRGIEQLNTMVKNLLDLGRLEAGLELMKSPVRLDSLADAVLRDLSPMAEESGVELVLNAPSKMPYLNLDNALMRQAIVNLVTNAIKYAPESGRITLSVYRQPAPNGLVGEEIVASVADNGPGIPPEEMTRLFEKFHRVQHRANIKVKGSGLGLAIVKLVAERHDGRAWAESELDKGSTFYISVPSIPVDFANL